MPRKARIDSPDALHHTIIRGIECKAIFKDNPDPANIVERVLKQADEQLEQKYRLQVSVISLQALVEQTAKYFKIDPENLKSASKERSVNKARRIFCYMAVRKLGYKCSDVFKTLGISAATVSKAVDLGSKLSQIGKIQKQILDN